MHARATTTLNRLREGWAGFLACVAASLVPATALALLMTLQRPDASFADPLSVLIGVAVVAFMHAVLLGLPASLFLVHKGWFRPAPMLAAGALVGALPASLIVLFLRLRHGLAAGLSLGHLQLLAACAALGALGALSFYVTHRCIYPKPNSE